MRSIRFVLFVFLLRIRLRLLQTELIIKFEISVHAVRVVIHYGINGVMNVAIATVLGLMMGLFVVFLLEYMDTKIKKPEDIEKHLGLPILGVVPKENL